MGLLDDVMTNPLVGEIMQQLAVSEEQKKAAKMQAIAQFGMGLLGTPKGREGRALGQSGIGAMQGYQQGLQGARDENLNKFKMQRVAMQMAEQERLRKQKEQEAAGLAGIFGAPPQSAPSPLQAMGPGGPTPQNLERVQTAAAAPPVQSDLRVAQYRQAAAYYAARGNVEAAAKYSKIADDMEAGDQFDTTPRTGMRDGKPYNYVLNKRGGVKQLDYEPAPDNQVVDLKDRSVVMDKLRTPAGTSLAYGQSPDSKASTAVQWANYGLAKQREGREAAAPRGVYDPERGILVDPRSGTASPVTMGGQPVGAKPSPSARKELEDIDAQLSSIAGAKSAAKETPSAFGFWRGVATRMGANAEALAGATDSQAETIARSYVFNNVSKIINERAGAAQSVQELARLRAFLPAESDGPAKIVQKLEAFETYLRDRRKGYEKSGPSNAQADPLGIR